MSGTLDSRAKTLVELGDRLFSKRRPLLSFWQEVADHFYPQRGDFTGGHTLSRDYASHLTTSYPLLASRELRDAFSTMLRPAGKNWFRPVAFHEGQEEEDEAGREFLDYAAQVTRKAMYDRPARFVRTTSEADGDFTNFGQTVILPTVNHRIAALNYQCCHLRDVVWCEGESGDIDVVHRNWTIEGRLLGPMFRGNVSPRLTEALRNDPYREVRCRHVVVPAAMYDLGGRSRHPFVSVQIDLDNQHVMEAVPSPDVMYVIPRWQTVSGSPYAHSPAIVAALPDARLIQAVSLTLLEVGEREANPPLKATEGAVNGALNSYPGGITWVDSAYDERAGAAIEALYATGRGPSYGLELQADVREMISRAFYLNRLTLPQMAGDMTAFEVGQRVAEYVRSALPLFEPAETEYNGGLLDRTFSLLWRNNAFGPRDRIPESLRGARIDFRFENPLRETAEREYGQKFLESKAMLAEAAALDPSMAGILRPEVALRDVLRGIAPQKWIVPKEEFSDLRAQREEQQAAIATMQQLGAGADVAARVGDAGKALTDAGMLG